MSPERKRQEEAERLAKAPRWRDEHGRVQRLERLNKVWQRNQQLRELASQLKTSVGDVPADSEVGKWMSWLSNHVETSNPLRHIRQRKGGTLTLYYHGYDHHYVRERGFTESDPPSYSQEKTRFGVELTCQPQRVSSYEQALKIELPEEFVLPYEWARESDWLYRVFRVPAGLLNRTLGYGESETSKQEDAADEGEDE